MDVEELLFGFFMFVVVVIPVFGITARFALTPMLETLIRLREASAQQSAAADERLADLTTELQRLSAAVGRLEEGTEFDRQIRRSADRQLTPPDPS